MGKPVIEVENLSKRYRLGSIGVGSFLDDLRGFGRKIGLPCKVPDPSKEFWALHEVSFCVDEGEVLGIIGHNGAGKSTLLKILSRITEPTSGQAILRGRVASLLEVGTGFHGEMSGRDNIYLNGSLNGLTKREIDKHLDSIIDFSEVEEFIDTPVKRYSSGMYVRLAFAVAAHLRPEILMVDEVLAVGDVDFQKRCINKMKEVSRSGRTILFVSHNLQTIRSLCQKCMVVKNGLITFFGPTHEAINDYLSQNKKGGRVEGEVMFNENTERYGTGEVLIEKISLLGENKKPTNRLHFRESWTVEVQCNVYEPISQLTLFLSVTDEEDRFIGLAYSCDSLSNLNPEKGNVTFKLNSTVSLLPGTYYLLPCLSNMSRAIDQIQRALKFTILLQAHNSIKSFPSTEVRGNFLIEGHWKAVSSK